MPIVVQPAPWSGTPTSQWANSGAAVPVMSGAGFNWASIVGGMVGGPVSHYFPTVRGVPMTASFVKRYGGLRGLGQDGTDTIDMGTPPVLDTTIPTIDTGSIFGPISGPPIDFGTPPAIGTNVPSLTSIFGIPSGPTTPQASTSSGINFNSLLQTLASAGASIGKQFAQYANPLYSKGTYIQTPQGLVYASNAATTGIPGLPGLNLGSGSSLLPILLIGGAGLLVVMMISGRR